MTESRKISGFNVANIGTSRSSGYRTKIVRVHSDDVFEKGSETWTQTPTKDSHHCESRETKSQTPSITPSRSDQMNSLNENKRVYGVDMEKLNGILLDLKKYEHVKADDLPVEYKEKLAALRHITSGLSDSKDPMLVEVLSLFKKHFDPNDIREQGTVASVISGCNAPGCLNIPGGCGHLCADSIMGANSINGVSPCDDAVVVIENGVISLKTHGKKGNERAWVYVKVDFKGLDAHMIKTLKENGIKYVKIVVVDGAKCIQSSPEFADLDLILKAISSRTKAESMFNSYQASLSSDSWWWWVIIAVFVLLLLILAVWLMVKSGNRSQSDKMNMNMSGMFQNFASALTPRV